MFIRILDRYIFREVFVTFLFGICAFSAVFIGSGTLFRIAQYITDYGASLESVAKIFVLGLPGVVIWTFPMSMLLAVLLTIGKMSSSSEITAMKSCGIGFFRIAAPAVLLGTLVSIFAIAFNEYVVPWANTAYSNVFYYEIEHNTAPRSQEHVIIKDIQNNLMHQLVYARLYDAEQEIMHSVTLQNYNSQGQIDQVETAEFAKWDGKSWKLYNGIIYDVTDDGKREHIIRFNEQILPIRTTPVQVSRSQRKPEELTMKELREEIDIMRLQFVDTKKLEVELYQRVTVPMASLIFALIGVPLGLQPTRNSSSMGFAMSVIIIFFYYAFMTMGNAIARGGFMPPLIAVWLPNIIGLVAGLFLMYRASR